MNNNCSSLDTISLHVKVDSPEKLYNGLSE